MPNIHRHPTFAIAYWLVFTPQNTDIHKQESRKAYGTADEALLALHLLSLNKMWLKIQ